MKSILVVGARGIPDVQGGAERYAERLFPVIANRGWQICVAGQPPFMRSGRYKGLSLWSPPSLGHAEVDRILAPVLTLFKAVRMRPDIIHLAGLSAATLLWAYKMLGFKTIVRCGLERTGGNARTGAKMDSALGKIPDALGGSGNHRQPGSRTEIHCAACYTEYPGDRQCPGPRRKFPAGSSGRWFPATIYCLSARLPGKRISTALFPLFWFSPEATPGCSWSL